MNDELERKMAARRMAAWTENMVVTQAKEIERLRGLLENMRPVWAEVERLRAALTCIAEWDPMLRGDEWHMRATARKALTGRDTPT